MAKTPTPTQKPVSQFSFDDNIPMPARTPRGGSSETMQKLLAMDVGQSFLEQVDVPTLSAAGEREVIFKEKAKTVVNRMGSTIRRVRKAEPMRNFSTHIVSDDVAGYGVRVWRIADSVPSDGVVDESTAPAA